MVHTCGLGSVHCTAFSEIGSNLWVVQETSSRHPGRNAIIALIFIIKTHYRLASGQIFHGFQIQREACDAAQNGVRPR
jgi:hypothetical protein